MQGELRRLTKKLGVTAVFVTHDQGEAMIVSDWVAVMNEGHIEQFATPSDVFQRPKTRFVADFMGGVNFLKAEVVEKGSKSSVLRVCGVTCVAPGFHQVQVGEIVDVVIRPEYFTLLPRGGPGTVLGRVTDALFRGNTWSYDIKLVCGDNVVVEFATGKEEAVDRPVEPGTEVWVRWNGSCIHILQ